MKRFTETTKWRDPWFRKLSPAAKLLWQYMCDNCIQIGLIDLDLEAASFDIGQKITDKHVGELASRLQTVGNGKFFIPKFIGFQYGTLTNACPPHRTILKLVSEHQLSVSELGYQYPNARVSLPLKTRQEEDNNGKGQETEEETMYSTESRVTLHFLNELTGNHYRESETSLAPINARLREPEVTLEGVKKMIRRQHAMWKDTRFADYLRPSTLFGKEKFNEYYANKDQPIRTSNGHDAPETKMTPEEMLRQSLR